MSVNIALAVRLGVLIILLLASSSPALVAGQIPRKWIGTWKGVSGEMEGSDTGQTGTATTKRDLGHVIEKFELEVAEDGSIKGTGTAKYWFNVAAQANLIVATVGPTAQLEGGFQARDFDITGEVKPDGTVSLDGTPKSDLVLINAGKRGPMGAWNVFGASRFKIREEGCKTVVFGTLLIPGPPIAMKLKWRAERNCKADCEVDRTEAGGSSDPRSGKVEKVIVHCTGGLHDSCDVSKSYKGGTVAGIVREFRNAETLNRQDPAHNIKKSIHYIVGEDGTVVRMVPEDRVAYHNYRYNKKYIGIELINDGNGTDPYPLEQVNAIAELLAEILRCHGLDSDDVLGHGDVDTRLNNNCTPPQPRRTDPGSNFPWEVVRTRIDALLAED
ncbi:MAG: N-acetylmuramoyl-L-alanine amidase [Thermoanaerobaculia bacterium]